jgi:orotate phosphoribosyltransferase-like protein
MSTEIKVPISPGELIDKITILEIKAANISDVAKLANVKVELQLLQDTWRTSDYANVDIDAEWSRLREINKKLWDIEDAIRDKERQRKFDQEFIELARSVYITNDERAAVKKQINTKLGSKIVEEKSYAKY